MTIPPEAITAESVPDNVALQIAFSLDELQDRWGDLAPSMEMMLVIARRACDAAEPAIRLDERKRDRPAQRRRLIATCQAMDPPWNPDGVRSLLTQGGTIDGDVHVAQAVHAERERWHQLAIAVGARYVTGVRGQPRCPGDCTYDGLMNLVTSGSHWHPFASLITDSDDALTSENTRGNTP